jgi:hypothetical protein
MIENIPTSDREIEQIIRKLLRENKLGKVDFIKSHMLTMNTFIQYFIHESLYFDDFEDFIKQQPMHIQERFEECYHFGKAFESELAEVAKNRGTNEDSDPDWHNEIYEIMKKGGNVA